MEPHKKLAGAVILGALSDAQNGSQEARKWLMEDDSSFPFWCRAYGVSPALARQELGQAIKTAPVTKKRRRELILQALREHPELSNREIGRRLGCNYTAVRRWRLVAESQRVGLLSSGVAQVVLAKTRREGKLTLEAIQKGTV